MSGAATPAPRPGRQQGTATAAGPGPGPHTPALMFLGTHSSAGKSVMATALCRLLARRGLRVAPFKAQNMSNNAGVTSAGGEMGRAQIVQAEAAGIAPHTDMNPVLLKPEAHRRSQVVLNGKVYGHLEARNWRRLKATLWDEVRAAYDRLARRFEFIVLEGAGSPAEINLKDGDIVNLAMARHAGAPCVLVGDIDRGGVFAALAGTVLLLEPEERRQIAAFLVNRFRGDPGLLAGAFEDLQRRACGIPTLGVMPWLPDLRVAEEDAVALERPEPAQRGCCVDIAVVHLPHVANFDDVAPLQAEADVSVRWVDSVGSLGRPQAVILPGTKATVADLAWLRRRGLDAAVYALRQAGCTVIGICGGYQMLGRTISDPHGVEVEAGTTVDGLGLLPVDTEFATGKETVPVGAEVLGGLLVEGYYLHSGHTTATPGTPPFATVVRHGRRAVRQAEGAMTRDRCVWGTYLHGLFDAATFRRRWLATLGWSGPAGDVKADYDRLADAFEAAVPWARLEPLLGLA